MAGPWQAASPGAPGDFRAQAVQAFENLKLALAAAGADFAHVVKVTAYFTDIADIATYLDVRNRYVNTKAPPASTAVQISKLAHDGALFEIEAIAVVPEAVSSAATLPPPYRAVARSAKLAIIISRKMGG